MKLTDRTLAGRPEDLAAENRELNQLRAQVARQAHLLQVAVQDLVNCHERVSELEAQLLRMSRAHAVGSA